MASHNLGGHLLTGFFCFLSTQLAGQLEVILDRRLMQDDNRGLGQGLKDNKRTCNRFRLLLERFSSANKVGSPGAPWLDRVSFLAWDFLGKPFQCLQIGLIEMDIQKGLGK